MLRKLSLHGFKSFCDRTEISLGPGITAIVGPNGCGKSNIADALRWVLGEQNPRVLRSSKQQDVIFVGTERRKAMGMAEVKLLFDGVSIVNDTETEISRRLTRDGSSEYKINGKTVRWKDIIEALSGTGLSHAGYVVIGQGMVQDLALARPQERREWIEEASGVSRVKIDKRQMESRLEKARTDMARLCDLLLELEVRHEQLSCDKDIAKEYTHLVSQRRGIELSMWLHQTEEEEQKLTSLRRRLEKYKVDMEALRNLIPELTGQEKELEAVFEKGRLLCENIAKDKDSALKELVTLQRQRDSAISQTQLLTRELESRIVRQGAIEVELEKTLSDRDTLKQSSETLSVQVAEARSALDEAQNERTESEIVFSRYSADAITARKSISELSPKLREYQKANLERRREFESASKNLQDLKGWLDTASQEVLAQEEGLESVSRQKESADFLAKEALALVHTLNSKQTELSGRLNKKVEAEKDVGARLAAQRARAKILTELQQSFEGYAKGPKTVLEAKAKGALSNIQGSVGELIDCEPRYIAALTAAISGALENIVVSDEKSARNAIEYLKSKKSGRATFLPIDLVRPRQLNARIESLARKTQGVCPILDVVSYPKEIANCVKYVLGTIVLADTLDTALLFMKASGWATRVVTLSGESLQPGGAITGGDAPRQESIFRRKQEVLTVAASLKALEKELASLVNQRLELERETQKVQGELEKARADSHRKEAQAVRVSEALDRLVSALSEKKHQVAERSGRVEALAARVSELLVKVQETDELENTLSQEMSEKELELRGFEEQMQNCLSEDREISKRVKALASAKEALDRDMSSVTRRLEGILGERASLLKNLEQETREISRQEALMKETREKERVLVLEIQSLEQQVRALTEDLNQHQNEFKSVSENVSKIVLDIEKARRDLETIVSKTRETSEEIHTLHDLHRETLKYLESEFGVSSPETVDVLRIPRSQGITKLEAVDLRLKAMGNVNLKALEEYELLSQRIETVKSEKEDVVSAIDEINKAREFVEKEIQARFLDTFTSVARSFSEIFKDLFGGGRGELTLVEDTLGVEVVAEPPGRKPKSISLLSGGERSLCGIGLVLAILSVKPSPLIVLDEVDTALDDRNVIRFGQFLKRYSKDTQFLVITHQKATMESSDLLYGVTMEEPGVSRVFGMRLETPGAF